MALHRQLWGDGVSTTQGAAAHINDIVGQLAERHLGGMPQHMCDLGCGVGGTLFHLAPRWVTASLTGITISELQRQRAEDTAQRLGLATRCRFVQADFTAPVESKGSAGHVPADLAIAIESHVHAKSAAAFLQGAAQVMAQNGVLVIVDDMLIRPEAELSPSEAKWLAAFREGWRLGHVPDRDGLLRTALEKGFASVETLDLTPLIRLDRLRDRALHIVGPLANRLGLNRWPIFGNMIGGDALTRLYHMGTLGYFCVVLRRKGDGVAG